VHFGRDSKVYRGWDIRFDSWQRHFFLNFTFMWPCIVTNFFIIKPTRCTNFTNLFWHESLHVSDSSSAHHEEFIHCTLSNGICHTILVLLESCLQTCMTYTIYECKWTKSWWWTEKLSETCRVSCKNKFVKLVHLGGCIIQKFFSTSRTNRFEFPRRNFPTQLHLMSGLRMSDRQSTQRHHALDTAPSALLQPST
jgi:hypothetical protein